MYKEQKPQMITQKNSAQNTKDKFAKYTIKDSVFTHLFREKRYLLQLYKCLHPEDTDVTEADITDITIENVLMDDLYNDLGMRVRDRLVILTEAQSTWSVNIVIRALLYLAKTYQDYIRETGQNLYRSAPIKLPKPELYVIYTGERKKKQEYILLSEAFFEESVPDLEVRVKVIYNSREGDILSQYIAFTKVYNEQMKMYGRTREAVAETIRICKDREILKEYLECHEREVADAMMTLFDQEEILRIYVEEKQKEAVKEVETKAAEATKIAKKEAELKSAAELLKSGKLTAEELPQFFSSLTESDINKIRENLQKDKEEE